ncbi:MAG: glycosyltransferase family 2 protein [Sphingobacteriales bacterium]|jgi:glycosyltransferase involved in cell wall biosynthesis|nr:glycosyltransferase family 2 protein [Sphingobacteriales bacterium]
MLNRLFIPDWVKAHNHNYSQYDQIPDALFEQIKTDMARFRDVQDPEVSIIVPAYNEEKDLLKTLSSLSKNKSPYRTELIVVNNNSKDHTQSILDRCGVPSLFERKQGVGYARQTGMEMARGKYILNADSDSIYPPDWGVAYVDTLKNNPDVMVTYGQYAFIPSPGNGRSVLLLHEMLAEQVFRRRKGKQEAINVLGFNFAFRKADALSVGGFQEGTLNRKLTGRCEDGWLAYQLADLGKIQLVKTPERVWTTDRRLMADGSLVKALINRIRIHTGNMAPAPR